MSNADYEDLAGDPVTPEGLCIPKAQALAQLLFSDAPYPFVKPAGCRVVAKEGEVYREIIIFDVDVSLSQRPVHGIQRVEHIAAVFREDDRFPPEALALRRDFPEVPHLNIIPWERPKSLCLSDQPYSEVRLRWTASKFVESIRTWLALTAEGVLHQEDQPLEPLLSGVETKIILPADLFAEGSKPEPLFCYAIAPVREGAELQVIIARRENTRPGGKDAHAFTAIPISVDAPMTHGVIRWQPANIQELHAFLERAGFDLCSYLRYRLRSWDGDRAMLDTRPIFVVAILKRRTDAGPIEAVETWAFFADRSLGEVGEAVGVLGKYEESWGLMFEADTSSQGEDVRLQLLLPYYHLSRASAAQYNGQSKRFGGKVVAVGMGALGSQVFDNLLRSGFAEWTIVDNDHLLPHNLARHELHGMYIGHPKVISLAAQANQTVDGPPVVLPLVADVLDPQDQAQALDAAIREAEIVLDMSASVAVARHLARDRDAATARRISLFLNPTGTDLVLLAEDAGRQYHLDALEMQYYRAVVSEPDLTSHLHFSEGRLRYGRSCRDTSQTLSQEQVALHAAIGSRALRRVEAEPDTAVIRVWRTDSPDLSVRLVTIPPAPVVEERIGEWTLCTDEHFLHKVRSQRRERLPNETGGVLIGSFDMERRIVYVADALPLPPDSIEHPTLYIRGHVGLREEVGRISGLTAGRLEYVGEWHSHPPGFSSACSDDDRMLFGWLKEEIAQDGHPPVMLIIAEVECRWHVASLPL